MIERNSEGKAIFIAPRFDIKWFELEELGAESDRQLELNFEDTRCKHKFEDDGENLRLVCTKCGYYHDVSFRNPYDGKTYQEVYEIMQRERHLKE